SRGENRAAWARAAEIRAGKINLSPFFVCWSDLIDLLEEADYAEVHVYLWLRYEPFARMVRL
ncbi:hypothetical protein, partial [Pseudomonas aeruginosa]|uniref:hypothetical protein n=1 Tax=Pseudomonas aeruginosa TaxID=287 RepID=UPI002407A19C